MKFKLQNYSLNQKRSTNVIKVVTNILLFLSIKRFSLFTKFLDLFLNISTLFALSSFLVCSAKFGLISATDKV